MLVHGIPLRSLMKWLHIVIAFYSLDQSVIHPPLKTSKGKERTLDVYLLINSARELTLDRERTYSFRRYLIFHRLVYENRIH